MEQNRTKTPKMRQGSWEGVRRGIHVLTGNTLSAITLKYTVSIKNSTVAKYAPVLIGMFHAFNHLESIYEFLPKHKEECEHFSTR